MSYLIAEDRSFANISATTATFNLSGGNYGLLITATFGGGNIQLQRLSNDGATWVNIGPAVTAAGYSTMFLTPGSYRFAVTTATAVYIDFKTIPF